MYIIGLANSIADENILKQYSYFGQYGKLVKIVVTHPHQSDKSSTCSAYITFEKNEDALACIKAIDGYYLEGKMLRYGPCPGCDCLELPLVRPSIATTFCVVRSVPIRIACTSTPLV